LAVALLFVEKIHQSDAQFWFGLRIVGFLQISYTKAVIQRTIVVLSRIFGARFGGKDCGLCKYNPQEFICLRPKTPYPPFLLRAVCSAQSMACRVHRVVCSVQCAWYSMQYAALSVHSVQGVLCRVLYPVYSVQRVVYSVQCKVFSVQCAVRSVL
jgi:hypothetical protein